MINSVLDYLNWANPKNIANSKEERFYDENASLFPVSLTKYNDTSSSFGLIRAVIILEGLWAKREIDHSLSLLSKDSLKDKEISHNLISFYPSMIFKGQRIYIPTYSISINRRYEQMPWTLKDFPYSALLLDPSASLSDPFSTYGNHPYSSPFTRLIRLDASQKDSAAFYHPDFQTIYVIDDQGGLEEQIPIFDDKISVPNYHDLLPRLEILMKDYFHSRMKDFLTDLRDLKLISSSLFEELAEVEKKKQAKKERIQAK